MLLPATARTTMHLTLQEFQGMRARASHSVHEDKTMGGTRGTRAVSVRLRHAQALKAEKQLQRFKKFQAKQLAQRKIDDQQAQFQKQLKQETLRQAKQKIFNEKEDVRKVQSCLLVGEMLDELQDQHKLKELANIRQKQRQLMHERNAFEIRLRQEQKQQIKREQHQKAIEINAKDLRRQKRNVEKKFVAQLRQQKIEGQVLLLQNAESLKREMQKQQAIKKRQRELYLQLQKQNIDRQSTTVNNFAKQVKQEETNREWQNRKDMERFLQDQVLKERVQTRMQLVQKVAAEMKDKRNAKDRSMDNFLQKQKKELDAKQAAEAEAKRKRIQEQKRLVDEASKLAKQKRQEQKQAEKQATRLFDEEFKRKCEQLTADEKRVKNEMRHREKALSEFHKRQAADKQQKIQTQIRNDLLDDDRVAMEHMLQKEQMRSFAEKCSRQWKERGLNVTPLVNMMRMMK